MYAHQLGTLMHLPLSPKANKHGVKFPSERDRTLYSGGATLLQSLVLRDVVSGLLFTVSVCMTMGPSQWWGSHEYGGERAHTRAGRRPPCISIHPDVLGAYQNL